MLSGGTIMSYLEACKKAYEYFKEQLGISGLATVTENDEKWFFSAGKNAANVIGNIVISISKVTGILELVEMLSDEEFDVLRKSTLVEIPKAFLA